MDADMLNSNSSLFLGFDLSTQSLKSVIIDENLKTIYSDAVIYSKDLSHYNTENGVIHLETGEYVSPVLMFIEALDLILERMKNLNIPFESIVGISGSAQQHGSIYWNSHSEKILKNLKNSEKLLPQFLENNCFSYEYAPIWMDSTTSKYCKELEETFGREKLCQVTGSKAFERFTGNQIKKMFIEKEETFINTSHISLISSFLAEIFLGCFTSIDYSDASGMNLFDITNKRWDDTLLNICGGSSLRLKLSNPVPSSKILGKIQSYFVKRYGFYPECKIIAFSGDNPCSLVGLGISHPGVVGISLGTSDTIFSLIKKSEAKCNFDGHLFVSPLNEEEFMMMACMKNGALVRERYKKLYAKDDWECLESLLTEENLNDNENIGFFFDFPEIAPQINVENFSFFQDKTKKEISIDKLTNQEIIQCLYESKAIILKLSLEKFGIKTIEKIIVTGGSSKSKGFLQIIANVFNCMIYKLDTEETAVLGAAYRAFHSLSCENNGNFLNIDDVITFNKQNYQVMAIPNPKRSIIYSELMKRYSSLLDELLKKFPYNK